MSCISELKILPLIEDAGDVAICDHFEKENASFLGKRFSRISGWIKRRTQKFLFFSRIL